MRHALFLLAGTFAALVLVAAASARPTIYVWNSSTVVSDEILQDCLPVWQRAIDEDFAPAWNAPADLVFSEEEPPTGEWQIEVTDNADVWGALAYHGVYEPAPFARVFVQTAVEYGFNWEVSLTHELWEMLADPYINRTIMVRPGVFYALEVADPVEDDSLAYWRLSPAGRPVAISDFVYESWFRPVFGVKPYDFAGYVTRPLQVLKGGYIPVWRGRGKWTTIENFHQPRNVV